MEFTSIPISDESVFPLDSLFLTLGGVEESHNISARSSIPRDKAVKKQTAFRHSTSKWTEDFDLADLELHKRNVGAHGPRLLRFYGGNTLAAQRRTVNEIEEYRECYNQSPITPIGSQGPRGGESQLDWKCNICERIFDTFQKVAVHLTSCEWGLANWKCLETSCDRVYQSRNELVRHKCTAHPHARPDEFEDTYAASPSTRHPPGPLHSQPTPLSQILDHPLQGKVMPKSQVPLMPPSLATVFPQAPPAPMYDQHTRASSTMPHSQYHPFGCWSSPHMETSQAFIRTPPLKTVGGATMDPNGQWLHVGHGLTGVPDVSSYGSDTSASFWTPSGSSSGSLAAPSPNPHYPTTPFNSQGNLDNSQGLRQPSSQSSYPSLAPASSISYFMNPLSRNPAPDPQYTQQCRPFQQVQTPDSDTNVTYRQHPSPADAWLHHESELEATALYQPAATSKQAFYSANVRTADRPGRFLSTNNNSKYVQDYSYGHQMGTT